jgi:DUF1680 family protein
VASPLTHSPLARWHALAFEDVTLAAGFWAARQRTNQQVSLGRGFRMLAQAGNFDNLRLAGGASGSYQGPVFMDCDVYKWLEAVAYAAPGGLSRALQDQADQTIALIQRAQAADGYLDSYYPGCGPELKWQEFNTGHEPYCAGHGCLVIERGPLVYCVEQTDQISSESVLDVLFDPGVALDDVWQPDLLGGLMTVVACGRTTTDADWDTSTFRPRRTHTPTSRGATPLTAIPYFAWANRQPGPMRVWLPT